MKPIVRYQSQLLFRKSYKPIRVVRIRPSMKGRTFRPSRDGFRATNIKAKEYYDLTQV